MTHAYNVSCFDIFIIHSKYALTRVRLKCIINIKFAYKNME